MSNKTAKYLFYGNGLLTGNQCYNKSNKQIGENYELFKVRGSNVNMHQKVTPLKKEKNLRSMLFHAHSSYGNRDMLRIRTEDRQVKGIKHETFMRDMNAFGNALLGLGLAGKKIAVIGPTSYEWLVSYFSVVCGVGAIVPIDKELQDDEIAGILRESEAECVIFADEYLDTMKNIRSSVQGVRHYINMNGRPDAFSESFYGLTGQKAQYGYEEREIGETEMCALLFTSGTTGKSKGVMLTHKSILAAAEGGLAYLEIGKVCLSVLPVHHSFECTHGIVMMIENGTTICINNSLRYFADNLKLFRPDAVFLVPLFIERLEYMIRKEERQKEGGEEAFMALLQKSRKELSRGEDNRPEYFAGVRELFGGNLSLLLCGGAPLSKRLMKLFRELGILLVTGYGITECSPLVSVNGNRAFKDGSVGRPIPCCEVKIAEKDENGEGEILVRGENVMLGYYKDEAATSKALQDGWFRTGDLGHIDSEGYLFITGRKKNLIVLSNGKNIYPEEIEDFIRQRIPSILEIVVYAPLEEGMNERVLAAEVYLGGGPERALAEKTLAQELAEVNRALPVFKRIQKIHVRDTEFEKTTKKSIKRFLV